MQIFIEKLAALRGFFVLSVSLTFHFIRLPFKTSSDFKAQFLINHFFACQLDSLYLYIILKHSLTAF